MLAVIKYNLYFIEKLVAEQKAEIPFLRELVKKEGSIVNFGLGSFHKI